MLDTKTDDAISKNIHATHLTYQDTPPFGVTFLNTLVEFSALILSSNFTLYVIIILYQVIDLLSSINPV